MKKIMHLKFLVFNISIVFFVNSCISASTPISTEPLPTNTASQPVSTPEVDSPLPTDTPLTIVEAEELAGFDAREPTYLPTGAVFNFATYQSPPYPNVTLHYKFVHETLGDMGSFFQILQEPQEEALPNPTACGVNSDECETLEVGDLTVKYRLTNPTEFLIWDNDGFSFQLVRTAGEPNKIYKDELLKVIESME